MKCDRGYFVRSGRWFRMDVWDGADAIAGGNGGEVPKRFSMDLLHLFKIEDEIPFITALRSIGEGFRWVEAIFPGAWFCSRLGCRRLCRV